jgi:hypothetical protein
MIALYKDGQFLPQAEWSTVEDVPVGLIAMGWEPVEMTPKPPDTPTTTHDPTNVDGTVTWVERDKDADELDRARREGLGDLVGQAIPWLRQRAAAADGVTVTAGNAVAVLQAVVDDMAIFFARFADYLEAQGADQ